MLALTLMFSPYLISTLLASQLIDGFIIYIDKGEKIMSIRDRFSHEERAISFKTLKDLGEIKPGDPVKMWVSPQGNGTAKIEKIYKQSVFGHDMTGIKKRLRKAAGRRTPGHNAHGMGSSRGNRTGHGKSHGRGHGKRGRR